MTSAVLERKKGRKGEKEKGRRKGKKKEKKIKKRRAERKEKKRKRPKDTAFYVHGLW